MNLSEIHNCEKCQGKMVCIAVNKLGISYCGYCYEIVDYREFFDEELLNEGEEALKDLDDAFGLKK